MVHPFFLAVRIHFAKSVSSYQIAAALASSFWQPAAHFPAAGTRMGELPLVKMRLHFPSLMSQSMSRLSLLLLFSLVAATRTVADEPDFNRQIAPLLVDRCLECHSGAEPEGSLDLTRFASATKGGESGPALVAGDLDKSLLWQRVADNEMPPKKPLSAEEKETLGAWIAAGAKWGVDPIDPLAVTTAHRAGYDWWSLQPIRRPEVPRADGDTFSKNDVDRFIYQQLKSAGLAPSRPAERATLIRRLSFDLVGLPPSPEEVQEFVTDKSPDAYAKVVERLLDSPHYGERWARHWLDVAHFGESDGFEYDRMRPNAWPYRDWVIAALNADMPYDEFARLQIAGDVLKPNDPDAIIAAGFLVHGAFDGLMPAGDAMRQIMRQDELEDIVSLVGQSFLGLTVHCARCHDHKFDPVRAEDYYRLASSLSGVRRGERELPGGEVSAELLKHLAAVGAELAMLEEVGRDRLLQARPKETKEPPTPLLFFEFADDDSGLKLHGGAKLESGALLLDGKDSYAATAPLDAAIREKTLEAWVKLDSLKQRGGGAISLQTLDGNTFDAIVFGEQQPGQWMAGSDSFRRTRSFNAPQEERAHEEFMHFAIVYAADGTITGYRNGEIYGSSYKAEGPIAFEAGKAQLVFGLRHAPVANGKMLEGSIERAALHDRALSAEEIALSAASGGKIVSLKQILAALVPDEQARHQALSTELARLKTEASWLKSPKVYTVTPKQPEAPTHLLLRGNPVQKGEVVAPAGLTAFEDRPGNYRLDPNSPEGERRRNLAEWIASRDNPLFARTIVNRVWHYHFGRGLVETPSDLGFNGGAASHPELLDYLADELIASGWRLKHLHRLIVHSAAYQQASQPRPAALAVDADNRLLWRFTPRRLDAEAIRDAVLSISGQLNPKPGGPSFMDFRPFDNHNSQYYEPIDPEGREFHRRSVYRMWARGGKSPLLDTFDCPDPSTSTPKRGTTTTPLQALALLNNSFMLRMSDAMAERLLGEAGDDPLKQIDLAFRLAYSREASEEERKLATAFVERNGLPALCRVILNTNGFLYVE
jgi:hypothetical protein